MTSGSLRRYENGLLAMLFLANGLMFFDRLALNFLAPFMSAELELTKTQIGALNSALGMAWAVSGFVFGRLVDRREIKRPVLVFAVVAFSLCSIGSGFAGGFMGLLLARVVMGIAEGPVLPTTQALMVVESSPSRRGFNMGFIQAVAAGVFGQILAPALIIPLATHFGWRTAFFIAGVPGLLLALLLWRKVREPALDRFRLLHQALAAKGPESSRPDPDATSSVWNHNVVLCTVISCLAVTTFFSVMVFAPLFLVHQRGLTTGQMGLFMTVLGVSSVVGGALVPAISDRIGRRPTLVAALASMAAGPLVVAFLPSTLFGLCLGIFVGWLGVGALSIALATVPAESARAGSPSKAIAVVVGLSEVVGGALSPVICGVAADRVGAAAPFVIGSGAALLAALVAFFIHETAPVRSARHAEAAASRA